MLRKIQELALFSAMFLFGFGWAKLYVPVIACYAMVYNSRALSSKMNLFCWINYLSALFFVLWVYLFGMEYLTVDSPVGTFVVVLFMIGLIVPIFNSISLDLSIRLVSVFLLGVFIYVASVVIYSLLTDPIGYGVGSLVSPFFPDLRYNTAAFSNYLTIVFCGFFYLALVSRRIIVRFLSCAVLLLSLIIEISLGGRTFFLLTFVFAVPILLKFNSKIVFTRLAIGVSILLVGFYLFNNEYPSFSEGLLLKFDSGLTSTRYAHWSYALQQIPTNPFGGFDVNQDIEEIHSFHNIIFDAARLGGWIPMILFLIILCLNCSVGIFMKNIDIRIYYFWMLSLVFMLNMMQDVILEGTYKYLILYVLLNNIVLKYSIKSLRPRQEKCPSK